MYRFAPSLQVWFLFLHAINRIRILGRCFPHCMILTQLCWSVTLYKLVVKELHFCQCVACASSTMGAVTQGCTGVQWLSRAAELAHLGSSPQELMKSIFRNYIIS